MPRLVEEGGAIYSPSPVNSGKVRKQGKNIVPIVSIVFKTSASEEHRKEKRIVVERPPQARTLACKQAQEEKRIVSIVVKTSASKERKRTEKWSLRSLVISH